MPEGVFTLAILGSGILEESMSTISRDSITSLTCGIRYEKSFRIGDISGSIFDSILHSESSPFGTEFFPRYQEINSHDKALINDERNYYLRLTSSDVIFQHTLFPEANTFDEELVWFKDDAVRYIVNEIISQKGIGNIIRFGFLITHIYEGENVGGNVLSKLTDGEKRSADQFTLRFGNKDTTAEGLIKKAVDDYVNRISTIKQIDKNRYEISLDSQYFFVPKYDDIKDWDSSAFIDKSVAYMDSRFYAMLNPIINEMVKAR
jgi:hypothetical protein